MSMISAEKERAVREEVMRVLADPMGWPKEMKDYIGRYLELDQPSFRLSQIQGWKSYIGNNEVAECSSALTLTTSAATVPGCEIEVANPGLYLVMGFFEAQETSSSTAKRPTVTTNTDNAGGVAWTNINNVQTEDGSSATALISVGNHSDYISCTNFNFTPPPSAEINGVEVRVKHRHSAGGSNVDINAQIIVNSAGAGETKTTTSNVSTLTDFVFGDSTDLWGLGLPGGHVDSASFGVSVWLDNQIGIASTSSIDVIEMTLHGFNLSSNFVEGYLYIDSDEQDHFVTIPGASIAGGNMATTSCFWLAEPTSAATLSLKAKKDTSDGVIKVETGTRLAVIRIN